MAVAGLLTGLLLLVCADASGTPEEELLREAESAFRAGALARDNPTAARPHFQKAASLYEALRQRGIQNAALCRNEGNAHFLAGDLPRAILAYRRGLRLVPSDEILRAHMAYARDQVAYPGSVSLGRPAGDHRPPWLPDLSPKACLLLFLGFYSAACFGATRWWMTRNRSLGGVTLAAAGIAALLGVSLWMNEWTIRQESLHPLVAITEDGVLLRKGNGFSYPPRHETPVNRGVEARLLVSRGEWIQIRLGGGETGWVPRAYALVDGA